MSLRKYCQLNIMDETRNLLKGNPCLLQRHKPAVDDILLVNEQLQPSNCCFNNCTD